MKKYFIAVLVLTTTTAAFAQKKHSKTPNNPPPSQQQDSVAAANKKPVAPPPAPAATPKKKVWDLTKRPADHFVFQLGYDNWLATPDSLNIGGFNRSANFYFMFDFPFKTDPRLSIGAGLGIGSSNIFFNNQEVLVAAYQNTSLAFPNETGGNHFKKYKLVTTFLEAPIELRYAVDPEHMDQSWKFAVGAKVGLMLSAYTKGKTLENSANQPIGNYIEKESSKQFFNTSKLAGTLRVSKGVIGVFAQFQVTTVLKASAGPAMYPFSAGIQLSGL